MIPQTDYKDKCWWCGKYADSAEHKYKKSDLIREFGSGPYYGDNSVERRVAINPGEMETYPRTVQGPKSKEAKFERNLCQKCNNERSQQYDRAYDVFKLFIKTHEKKLWNQPVIQFSEMFGDEWKTERINMLRYLVKNFCCELADHKIKILDELIKYLDGAETLKYLDIHFILHESIVQVIKRLQELEIGDGCLWRGGLSGMKRKSSGEMEDILSFIGYRWLRVYFVYDDRIQESNVSRVSEELALLPFSCLTPSLFYHYH